MGACGAKRTGRISSLRPTYTFPSSAVTMPTDSAASAAYAVSESRIAARRLAFGVPVRMETSEAAAQREGEDAALVVEERDVRLIAREAVLHTKEEIRRQRPRHARGHDVDVVLPDRPPAGGKDIRVVVILSIGVEGEIARERPERRKPDARREAMAGIVPIRVARGERDASRSPARPVGVIDIPNTRDPGVLRKMIELADADQPVLAVAEGIQRKSI